MDESNAKENAVLHNPSPCKARNALARTQNSLSRYFADRVGGDEVRESSTGGGPNSSGPVSTELAPETQRVLKRHILGAPSVATPLPGQSRALKRNAHPF